MSILAGIGSVLGGIGGLFGSRDKGAKQLDPWHAMKKQVAGARDHGKEYGFNPLTLLQYGATSGMSGGGGGGSTPPLASVAAITGGLADINDVTSGDKARRDAREDLENDLLKLQIDKFRSGVLPSPVVATAVQSVSPSPSPLGRRSVVQPTVSAATVTPKFSQGENPIAPGRKEDIAPLTNSPGVFELENAGTPYGAITIPGEGEPWGIDELVTGVAIGAPQVAYGAGKKILDDIKDARDDTPEERSERRRKAVKDHVLDHPPGVAGIFSRSMDIWR